MDYEKATEDAHRGDGLAIYEILAKEADKCAQEEVLQVIHKISLDDYSLDALALGVKINGGGASSRDVTLYFSDSNRESYIPLVTIESVPLECP